MRAGPGQFAEGSRVNVTGTGDQDGEYVITTAEPGENGTVSYSMTRADKIVPGEVEADDDPPTIAVRRRDLPEAAG